MKEIIKTNLERFAENNPQGQEITKRFLEEYIKAWGDPNNTEADNEFMRKEALKEALDSEEMKALHKKLSDIARKNMIAKEQANGPKEAIVIDTKNDTVTTAGMLEKKDN